MEETRPGCHVPPLCIAADWKHVQGRQERNGRQCERLFIFHENTVLLDNFFPLSPWCPHH